MWHFSGVNAAKFFTATAGLGFEAGDPLPSPGIGLGLSPEEKLDMSRVQVLRALRIEVFAAVFWRHFLLENSERLKCYISQSLFLICRIGQFNRRGQPCCCKEGQCFWEKSIKSRLFNPRFGHWIAKSVLLFFLQMYPSYKKINRNKFRLTHFGCPDNFHRSLSLVQTTFFL